LVSGLFLLNSFRHTFFIFILSFVIYYDCYWDPVCVAFATTDPEFFIVANFSSTP
jgi:hypothetical protein